MPKCFLLGSLESRSVAIALNPKLSYAESPIPLKEYSLNHNMKPYISCIVEV